MAGFDGTFNSGPFDVAIIGAGVVGCAVARRFTLEGARVVLLERAPDLLDGASKGNSAILHTGFDAVPDSLELACLRAGYDEYMAIRETLGLPLLETGALVVAWTEADARRLQSILRQAHRNGIAEARPVTQAELSRREPNLAADAIAAVLVPGEHVIDPWSAPLAYLTQAVENGATALFNAPVERGDFDGRQWLLETPRTKIAAGLVINCAGLHGDLVDRALVGEPRFTIRPRKGQFVVFDKAASSLINAIILPVPDERTKGVVLARTVFGNLLIGPTAEEQEDRDHAAVDAKAMRRLIDYAVRLVPALRDMPVTAAYAGLRPGTERKDYRIEADPGRAWITVGGIRSTGLTAALGIARHVFGLYAAMGRNHAAISQPACPRVPNLAEHLPRDWQQPGYGEIVCHCEMVTQREIERALQAPLPAGDLGGLKRRTRATLGRCQGFYCLGRIATLTRGRLQPDIAVAQVVHG